MIQEKTNGPFFFSLLMHSNKIHKHTAENNRELKQHTLNVRLAAIKHVPQTAQFSPPQIEERKQ